MYLSRKKQIKLDRILWKLRYEPAKMTIEQATEKIHKLFGVDSGETLYLTSHSSEIKHGYPDV